MIVVPELNALPQAAAAFDAPGGLLDDRHQQPLLRDMQCVLRITAALKAGHRVA